MKTNNILLIVLGSIIMGMMIFFIFTLKRSLDIVHERQAMQEKFKVVAVDNFDKLNISSNWEVYVHQGKRCLVSYEQPNDSLLKITINNINGTLVMALDSVGAKNLKTKVKARIAMPFIHGLNAGNDCLIRLSNFTSDSVQFTFNKGCKVISFKNSFKKAWYKNNGEVDIEWIGPL